MKRLKFIKESKTQYMVENQKGEYIGYIFYDKDWKCWVWDQATEVIMSHDCLQEIVDELKNKEEKT